MFAIQFPDQTGFSHPVTVARFPSIYEGAERLPISGRLFILGVVIKTSKEPRQNIRYLGFETTSDGGRRFDFSITAQRHNSVRVTLDIPGAAFNGDNRISYQESAKICYEKLRILLEADPSGATASIPVNIHISREDIAHLRHIPRGRARPTD